MESIILLKFNDEELILELHESKNTAKPVKDAIKDDYQNFYARELGNRKDYMFPPFCYMLKITVRRATLKSSESTAEKIKEQIQSSGFKVRVEGPAPAFYERFQNKYQWQLVLKSKDRGELLKVIETLPANCSYDIDPLDLL